VFRAVGGGLRLGFALDEGPSSTSASKSCLSRPVLPRRLWRVVSWVGFLLDMISRGGERVVGGVLPRIGIGDGVCVTVYV
jgi:hypothetical protein